MVELDVDLARRLPVNPLASRRRLLGTGLGLAATFALARRPAGAQAGTPTAGAGEWSFTDDSGQEITLPAMPENVVAYLPIAAGLWDFGVRPVAVYGTIHDAEGNFESLVGNIDVDAVVSLGETYGEMDLELLAQTNPDLVVNDYWFDAIDVWGLPPEAIAQIEELAPIAHIRFVDKSVKEIIERVEELAGLLGADLESAELVEAKEALAAAEEDLKAAIAEKPDLTAMFLYAGADNLSFGHAGRMADLIYFRELGLNIPVVENPDDNGIWETVSWEQVGKYPADIYFLDDRSFSLSPEQLAEIPVWTALPAVQAEQTAPWKIEYVPSYQALTTILTDLAAAIRAAEVITG